MHTYILALIILAQIGRRAGQGAGAGPVRALHRRSLWWPRCRQVGKHEAIVKNVHCSSVSRTLAHSSDASTDIMDQALAAHVKILDYSCTQYREQQKNRWLDKCVEELKSNDKWVPFNYIVMVITFMILPGGCCPP